MIKPLSKYFFSGLLNLRSRAKFLVFTLAYFLIKPFLRRPFKNRQIWIVGENIGECLKDNGYCFFRYCCENNIDQKAYFLSRKKNMEDDPYLASNRNVIRYGSIRHFLMLLIADVYIYSHTHKDIASDKFFPFLSKRKKMVFLQHGVTGFKKFDNYYQKYCNEPDILVVVSAFEKRIIADQVGTREAKIKITGFPRYDYLSDTAPRVGRKQLAYMPTWREWLKAENFPDSSFYRRISSLIVNKSLAEFLVKNDLILKLYLHKNMKDCISSFPGVNGVIQPIRFGQESVQQMIRESSLLITDYSSISWDFYYLDKPVIFYQFDLDDYLNYRGSYLDFKKDMFGDTVNSEEALLGSIKGYAESNFQGSAEDIALKSNFFQYFDKSNCERICQEILKL